MHTATRAIPAALYGISLLTEGLGFFRLVRDDRALEQELADDSPIAVDGGTADGTANPTPPGHRTLSEAVTKPLEAQITGRLTLALLGTGLATGAAANFIALYT